MEKTPENTEKNALPLKEMPDIALKMEIRQCSRTLVREKLSRKKREEVIVRLGELLEELQKRESISSAEKIVLAGEAERAIHKK